MATAQSITELTALTTPAGADLLCIVDDVGGAAEETKKITVTNFLGVVAVNIVQGDALNIQTDKVRARDGDGLYLVDDGNNGLFVKDGGSVFLGDTANAKMTLGLTINQGANDDEILALKSSDVNHGMTDETETDTWGVFKKSSGVAGGLRFLGFSDSESDYGAVEFFGAQGATVTTTKSAAGYGAIRFEGGTKSGTGVTGVGADGNIVSIGSWGSSRFLFDAEGEMHSDAVIGVGDDWDEWDDLALAADLSRLPKAKFNEMMKYKAEDFERAGLLTLSTDEHGNRHAFIRHKAMLQFTMCCFEEVVQRMRIYEQALLSLGVIPKLLEA